jgi:protein-L-isoaspartate(D-aspartate) O-methyltransferase
MFHPETHLQASLERTRMVHEQLRLRGLRDERVLAAMERIPRHEFIPPDHRGEAYQDQPVPLLHGQTISQPYIVAMMIEALRVQPECCLLEVGTGTGYQAAILSQLAERVVTVERLAELADLARENLQRLGIADVEVVVGDGSLGYPAAAPYDRIIVAAAAPRVPQALTAQLAEGGILVIPVGDAHSQVLQRLERRGESINTTALDACRFVPLLGAQGFDAGASR